MIMEEFLTLLNSAALTIGVTCMILTYQQQLRRLVRYLRLKEKVPLLLWRDILLVSSFTWLFGGALVSRMFDLSFRDNPLWVIPTDILGVVALTFWAYVELRKIDDPEPTLTVQSSGKK